MHGVYRVAVTAAVIVAATSGFTETTAAAGTPPVTSLHCRNGVPAGYQSERYTSCTVEKNADGSGRIFWDLVNGPGWDVTTLDGDYIEWTPELY